MIKILWLCNIVLPDFSDEFDIKKNPYGGWMTGMLHQLEKREDVNICLCFPIFDSNRRKDGISNGHEYYSFLCDMDAETYSTEMVEAFEKILEKSGPDIVHIWGTEYSHTGAMLQACNAKGILSRAIVNIQGLVSVCSKHYLSGLPEEIQKLKCDSGMSIEEEKLLFEKHGKCEIESIRMVKHVIGRTDWDRACVEAINPRVNYYFCNEILRDIFYEEAGTWRYEECQKFSIFVSQASYPIKGFHYLLEALPIVIGRFPDTQVYVAGTDILGGLNEKPYASYLKKLIEQFDLVNHISFLGNLNEVQMIQQYKKANVFLSASTIENESNSLSESKILGVPSIASFVGGVCNRINTCVDGFLYPHDEPALMAYYICKIFENKNDLCTQFSKNSVRRVLEENNPQQTAECNVQIYKTILSDNTHKINPAERSK